MELVELINLILPLLNGQNGNNNFQGEQNQQTSLQSENLQSKQYTADFNSPFFSLPNYTFAEEQTNNKANKTNNQTQTSAHFFQNSPPPQNTQFSPPPQSQQSETGFNLNSIITILNLLKQLDLKSISNSITSLFKKEDAPPPSEKQKDTEVSFKTNYTKVDSYTYD